ncbi:MAG: ATP/maltotriose-dependent transcriptional regulator MalT [Myxococcota bacterium]|jgi:ATP/maltotriose-dependent transcriptional regulator MalT
MHFYATITRMRVRLYRGDTAGALALLQAHRHDVRRSGALNSGSNRVMWAAVAGSVIAVAVREGPLPRSALREATQLAKGVHWPDSWFGAWAHVVFAAVAQVNGEPERALADLDRVEAIAVEQEVHTWVDLARYRRAQIRRDAEGLDAARAALRARGARDPDRWVASWCGELDG